MIAKFDPIVPLTVPASFHDSYRQRLLQATHGTGRLFLFAGDQKIEHLNTDFYGDGIPEQVGNPKHLFEIASKGRIGVFASQLGLIARYGMHYRSIPYLVKLNGKTSFVSTSQTDPVSMNLTTVAQVAAFQKQSGLHILGIGITVYLGSEHEHIMLAQAAQAVYEAHQQGFFAVIWMYPRGKAVQHEKSADVVAGAAGVAVCLGADFVKINPPDAAHGFESAQQLRQATQAAGNTSVVCSGGAIKESEAFLRDVYHQIHTGGARGIACGRNIHQRPLDQALRMCNALAAIVIDDVDVAVAAKLL